MAQWPRPSASALNFRRYQVSGRTSTRGLDHHPWRTNRACRPLALQPSYHSATGRSPGGPPRHQPSFNGSCSISACKSGAGRSSASAAKPQQHTSSISTAVRFVFIGSSSSDADSCSVSQFLHFGEGGFDHLEFFVVHRRGKEGEACAPSVAEEIAALVVPFFPGAGIGNALATADDRGHHALPRLGHRKSQPTTSSDDSANRPSLSTSIGWSRQRASSARFCMIQMVRLPELIMPLMFLSVYLLIIQVLLSIHISVI